ncbi:hypothetical protein [Piscinibacterium candidicorallinum]|jgi:hypothetical protein|uniref:Uncharacterized protein n=1 Tax=Piscinibacterium candidicorallinum TaxID=1793872 RepID=A0ABV7H671_9BURK
MPDDAEAAQILDRTRYRHRHLGLFLRRTEELLVTSARLMRAAAASARCADPALAALRTYFETQVKPDQTLDSHQLLEWLAAQSDAKDHREQLRMTSLWFAEDRRHLTRQWRHARDCLDSLAEGTASLLALNLVSDYCHRYRNFLHLQEESLLTWVADELKRTTRQLDSVKPK